MQNHQSETLINNCKKVFSQFGIPKELNMDNGPEFSSHKFFSFSKTWDIHKKISSHHHQSNGLAERFILTAKQTLNKVKFNSEDHFLAMLSLNSQTDQNGTSPAKKIIWSQIKINVTLAHSIYQSTTTEKHTVTQNLKRKLSEIAPGTTVRIRTNEQNLWDKKVLF